MRIAFGIGMSSGLRQLRASLGSLAAVFANPDLARLIVGWAGMTFATWAFAIALGVYAFGKGWGRTTAVGVAALVRLLPGALASPFAGLIGDSFSRRLVLMASAGAQWRGDPPGRSRGRERLTRLGRLRPGRSLHHRLDRLRAGGGGAPAPGRPHCSRRLSAAKTSPTARWTTSASCSPRWRSVGCWPSPTPRRHFGHSRAHRPADGRGVGHARPRSARGARLRRRGERGRCARANTAIGFRALGAENPKLRLVAITLTVLVFIEGAADVMVVVVALDLLGIGEGSVHWLNSAWAVGALVAGSGLAVLMDRGNLAAGLAAGCLVVGGAFALPRHLAGGPRRLPLLFLHRLRLYVRGGRGANAAPAPRLRRDPRWAIGFLETSRLVATALGGIAAPAMVALFGIRGALVALGTVLPGCSGPGPFGTPCGNSRCGAPVPERRFTLLRGASIFTPLPVDTLEGLCRSLVGRRGRGGRSGDRAGRTRRSLLPRR